MKTSWIPSLIRMAVAAFGLLYLTQRAQSSTAKAASALPAPIMAAQNAYGGCLVAPDDSIYNTPIDTLPVHANSADWIAQSLSIGSVGVSFGKSWDVNVVDNSVTPTAMTFHYTTGKNGALYPLLTGNNRTRETGSYTTDGNNDHHMITLNRATCHWYETYQDNLTGSVTPAPAPYAASGWDYLGTAYTQPTDGTTDAAGLPLMPLTVRLSEMQAGAIHHAMRFTSCAGCISNVALWPATGSTAYSAQSAPMGSRWRLKASYDESKLSAKARIITTALKTYGMILADIGGISQIQVAQDINLDPSVSVAFDEVGAAHITQDSFEIVDESSLMVSPTSHQAKGGIPASAPVLIGTTSSVIFPQAGTIYQLPSWVNGSSDQTVVWSLLSGAGSVTSAGLYTAPTSITAPVPFVLKGMSEIDSLNPVFISGKVMPAGTMRINVGSPSAYTDTKGNTWLADNFGVLAGSFMNNNDTYPSATWAAVGTPPDGQNVFGWSKYTWGDDIQYGPFIVPNGTYSVQFQMAVSCPAGTTFSETQTYNNGLTRGGTVGLEANGAMTLFSIGGAIQDACLTPAMPMIETVVTNNVLRVALRSTSVGNTQQSPFLNALIITPETAPPVEGGVVNINSITGGSVNAGSSNTPQTVTVSSGLLFVPVTPCRVADTRDSDGPLGGPVVSGNTTRDFPIPSGGCGIPPTALAYSLNVTVVPSARLGYLSVWPAGQVQPPVSILNSVDGRVKANAAIVPAGNKGSISVFAQGNTHVILDINGYFVPATNNAGLAFYPLTPCRVVDTREATGPLGGPSFFASESRNLPIQLSACNIPSTAEAYSLNFTVVPSGSLGYISAWPSGKEQPLVSTLNDVTGTIGANAAIVPAGSLGDISVFTQSAAGLIIDINGYFAPPGDGGLFLYNLTPCRVLDTRNGNGAFTGPLDVKVSGASCDIPASARSYVLNATVVPSSTLGYLSLGSDDQTLPLVSTLNAVDGAITSNMAIVPTTDGSVGALAQNMTQLILDCSAYFAP